MERLIPLRDRHLDMISSWEPHLVTPSVLEPLTVTGGFRQVPSAHKVAFHRQMV